MNIGAQSSRAERIAALGYDYASQPKRMVDRCNLCGETRFVDIVHSDRYGYPATASACASCSLTQLNPHMVESAYGQFYESIYRPLVSAYHGRLIDSQTVKADQIPYAQDMAEQLRRFVKPSYRTFLDVGGSTGIIALEFAQQYGWNATLIDPAPSETQEAERAGIESITGFIETWDAGDRKFDVVGLFQTIDHLMDVKGTLSKIREVLADGGLFVVDIVDFRAAYLRNQSVEEAVKVDHVFSLTQEVTEAYLALTGFEWIHKSYAADHLHVRYFCCVTEPNPAARPTREFVDSYFREIRQIQNSQ